MEDLVSRKYGFDLMSVGEEIVRTKVKGNADKLNLAVWEKDGFSFSVQISVGVSEKEILDIVKNVY